MKKQDEVDIVDSMSKIYDLISEQDKKIFCERILQKKEFFTDAYKMMTGYFENALKEQKGSPSDNVADCNVEQKQADAQDKYN